MKDKKENKTNRITIRFTDSEWAKLKSDMNSHDYNSLGRYIRHCALEKRLQINKVVITDRSLRNQINELTLQIQKIGVNYNQVVKRYESLTKKVNEDGTPVLSSRGMSAQIFRLHDLTDELLKKMSGVIETVEKIKIKSESCN